MREVWLRSYPAGVQPHIDLNEYTSINEILARSCEKFPGRPSFKNLGATITYQELERLSRAFAAFLQGLPGLHKESRIALMLPNVLQYPITFYGSLRAGMIVVNVNPLYTARELELQLADSGARAIVVLENFAHVVEKVLPRTDIQYVLTTQVGDLLPLPRRAVVNFAVKRVKKLVPPWRIREAIPLPAALQRGEAATLDEVTPRQDDVALLQYTGGTTGVSKGAVLTHGNLVANVLQAAEWSKPVLEEGRETVVTALPLYHIFSLTVNCLLFTKIGGLNLLITNPRDMPAFVKELTGTRFTAITGVNTLYNSLLNAPGFAGVNFRQLKISIGGGAAIHRAVADRWRTVTGCPINEGYGLTEASPLVACNPLREEYSGAIGLPMPSTDVVIRDSRDDDVPTGTVGEICVRGPQVTSGYWKRPEESSKTVGPDGWLRTGDIGVMDDRGFIRVTDRKKDIILVSGFNVYPAEVEDVLDSIPGILESAVVGVPDDVTGEVVKAFVVTSGGAPSQEAIIRHCRQRLTSYKVPKLVEYRSELPKNPIGKVLRRELRPPPVEAKARAAGSG